jgi:hypothetical protein
MVNKSLRNILLTSAILIGMAGYSQDNNSKDMWFNNIYPKKKNVEEIEIEWNKELTNSYLKPLTKEELYTTDTIIEYGKFITKRYDDQWREIKEISWDEKEKQIKEWEYKDSSNLETKEIITIYNSKTNQLKRKIEQTIKYDSKQNKTEIFVKIDYNGDGLINSEAIIPIKK